MPSVIEYSLWQRRCTKEGKVMGKDHVERAGILPRPPPTYGSKTRARHARRRRIWGESRLLVYTRGNRRFRRRKPMSAAAAGAPLHILLITAAPQLAGCVERLLEEQGARFTLDTAPDCQTGCARLENRHFDAALLDLALPDCPGVACVSHVHQLAPDLPILVLTRRDEASLGLQAVQAGAQDYLVQETLAGPELCKALHCAMARCHRQSALRAQSLVDALTGIYNRRGFMTLAEHQVRLARRRLVGFHLIFIDIDGMKRINDRFGHAAGDRALVATAQILADTFRGSDIVARMGGDEFAVLSTEADGHGAAPILARLEAAVARHNRQHPDEPPLSLSCGAVYFDPCHEQPLDVLLAEADRRMYASKRAKHASRA
jgi:diguanylate cyclase (GGDEF)-like protein